MNDPIDKGLFAEHPGLVLLVALIITVLLWYLWLTNGIEFAHEQVAKLAIKSNNIFPSIPAAALAPGGQSPPLVDHSRYFAEAGQTGDAFGGVNALLTAIAGSLVAWAGYMQYLSLRESRVEAKEERKARQRQEFESLFFRMLDLSRELTNRIESSINDTPKCSDSGSGIESRTGAAALDSFAAKIRGAWKPRTPLMPTYEI